MLQSVPLSANERRRGRAAAAPNYTNTAVISSQCEALRATMLGQEGRASGEHAGALVHRQIIKEMICRWSGGGGGGGEETKRKIQQKFRRKEGQWKKVRNSEDLFKKVSNLKVLWSKDSVIFYCYWSTADSRETWRKRREDESILFFKDALEADFKQVAGCKTVKKFKNWIYCWGTQCLIFISTCLSSFLVVWMFVCSLLS